MISQLYVFWPRSVPTVPGFTLLPAEPKMQEFNLSLNVKKTPLDIKQNKVRLSIRIIEYVFQISPNAFPVWIYYLQFANIL